MIIAVIGFCSKCGSHRVDVVGWQGEVAQTHCANCYSYGAMAGITFGRIDLDEATIAKAQADRAHNKFLKREGVA